ncbi:SEC-C domain-containing protein [Asanoa sp. NPDC049573]|uniref:SEC-C domain-containing protein n=1 Tax=Asanoa sp. NPDC049573 TaxID=3155396 RepID=UPI0034222210
MTTASALDAEELELIATRAADRGEPAAGAAELVAAVDGGRLADPQDASIVLGMAAELLLEADDPAASLALTERVIDAHGAHGSPSEFARMFRARLLFLLDRADEAMAELTPLRPLLTSDPDAAAEITEALLAGDRDELAHEWLTEAVAEAQQAVPEDEPDDDAGRVATMVLFALLTERHEVRHGLGLPHDSLDETAEELEAAVQEEERAQLEAELSEPVLFFPSAEFDELSRRLPEIARICGPTWDEHRADIERVLAARAEEGLPVGLRLVRGSAAGLEALIDSRAADDPVADDVFDDYVNGLDGQGAGQPWPPARNEACWCGSGAKYKKCCLPRSRVA